MTPLEQPPKFTTVAWTDPGTPETDEQRHLRELMMLRQAEIDAGKTPPETMPALEQLWQERRKQGTAPLIEPARTGPSTGTPPQ